MQTITCRVAGRKVSVEATEYGADVFVNGQYLSTVLIEDTPQFVRVALNRGQRFVMRITNTIGDFYYS